MEIFSAVNSIDKVLRNELSKKVHGFTPGKLVKRPPAIAAAIDQAFFEVRNGKLAEYILTKYFTECEKQIDTEYTGSFNEAARANPNSSSRDITEAIVAQMKAKSDSPRLIALYEAALQAFYPHRYSDDSPAVEQDESPEEVDTDDESPLIEDSADHNELNLQGDDNLNEQRTRIEEGCIEKECRCRVERPA